MVLVAVVLSPDVDIYCVAVVVGCDIVVVVVVPVGYILFCIKKYYLTRLKDKSFRFVLIIHFIIFSKPMRMLYIGFIKINRKLCLYFSLSFISSS